MTALILLASVSAASAAACSAGFCTSGVSSGNALLQQGTLVHSSKLEIESRAGRTISCDEDSWPDKDHGLVCGECKVLVNRFSSFYKTCNGYCETVGRTCEGAWEEKRDTCKVDHEMTCDQTLSSSDAICECGAEMSEPEGDVCYGELTHLAEDEGGGIGTQIFTDGVTDADDVAMCQRSCSDNDQCRSFSLCPQWNGCWMKDRTFTGGEPTRVLGECKTYYKKPCGTSSVTRSPTASTPSPAGGNVQIRIASYNLYWWNAFDQNAWKGTYVTNNIRDNLGADVLGLQECDSPDVIEDRTGDVYVAVSDFAGAQGVVAKKGLFTVGDKGSKDIRATGKWGPRFVTWAQLTHNPSGRTFWHFNTHWCVHSDKSNTCSAGKRYTGARNMLDIIREKAGNAPVIITGDFNAAMDERGPQHFLQNGFSLAKNHWVDAIFYSTAHWQLGQTELGDAAYSDHRPVIAELTF